jgi:hypothetical protein
MPGRLLWTPFRKGHSKTSESSYGPPPHRSETARLRRCTRFPDSHTQGRILCDPGPHFLWACEAGFATWGMGLGKDRSPHTVPPTLERIGRTLHDKYKQSWGFSRDGNRQVDMFVYFGYLGKPIWSHSINNTSKQNIGALSFPDKRATKEKRKGCNRNSQLLYTNQSVRGTLYFYKTITKYSKIHFSKFTAVMSQFINAKTSFVFLCTNHRLLVGSLLCVRLKNIIF